MSSPPQATTINLSVGSDGQRVAPPEPKNVKEMKAYFQCYLPIGPRFLVHGDIHEMNALRASDGSYKLIDPAGLRAEPACDLGTIVRCRPLGAD